MNALFVFLSALTLSTTTAQAAVLASTRVQLKLQGAFVPADNLCIAAPSPSAGSSLSLAHCGAASTVFRTTSTNTQLVVDAAPALCVTAKNSLDANTALQLEACDTGEAYSFFSIPGVGGTSTIVPPAVHQGFGYCTVASSFVGANVHIENCQGSGQEQWTVSAV